MLPVDEELTLDGAVAYPIKAHVNCFRSFLFDGVVGEAVLIRTLLRKLGHPQPSQDVSC